MAVYQPSIPIHDRPEHPFASQFGNYWAWRFADALEALAATATPPEFQRRILVVHRTLVDSDHSGHADAWQVFVTRKIGVFRSADIGPHLMGHRDGLGGPGTDQPSYGSVLGQRPAVPFTRSSRARLPEDLPAAADVLVPPGCVAEPASVFEGIDVDIVYDPLSHEVLYTPTGVDRGAALEADGWQEVASGRHRIAWLRERSIAARRALARLDAADANPTRVTRHEHGAIAPGVPSERPVYTVGESVRWRRWSRNWRYGRLADPPRERDGSLRVVEDGSGATRSLWPSELERQVRGPRGGRKWVPCQPADTPTKPPHLASEGVAAPPPPTARATQGLGR